MLVPMAALNAADLKNRLELFEPANGEKLINYHPHFQWQGPEMTLYVNGVLMCQITDNDASTAARSGIIGLQMHPGPPMKVQFKNLEILIAGKEGDGHK